MTYPNNNGFTQKEMLNLILEGKQDINKRIDQLHEKVNQKISRQELSGWLVAISAILLVISISLGSVALPSKYTTDKSGLT